MSGTLQLGRIFGVNIRIHFSWIFIFALVAWSLATSFLPNNYPGWTRGVYWGVGALGSALLFVSVLIHELSHSLLAISRGHKVRGITLFFLGGISEIEEEAHNPGEEFWISVVGPLSSFVISALFWVLLFLTRSGSPQIQALFAYLAFVNAVVGVFNMLPAFPLDGGRVLRSIVWRATGSLTRATAISSITGSLLGFTLIAGGIYFAFADNFITGLWLVFVGWFIQSSASSIRRQQVLETALSGKLARDAMRENFPTIPPGTTAQSLLDDHISREYQRAYLVMLGDTFHGLVTISDIAVVPPEERGRKYVTEIMTPASKVVSVRTDEALEKSQSLLVSNDFHQLVVMENGKPVGLLTRGDVLRVMEINQLIPS